MGFICLKVNLWFSYLNSYVLTSIRKAAAAMNNLITAAYYMLLHCKHICRAVKDTGQVSALAVTQPASQYIHCEQLRELRGGRRALVVGKGVKRSQRIAADQQDTLERWKVTAGSVLLWCHFSCLSLGGVLELVSPFRQMALTASCGGSVLVFTLLLNFLSCLLYLIFSMYYYEYVTFKGIWFFFPSWSFFFICEWK